MSNGSSYYACIMAGGSGERFWPMSRARTPKHLLKLLSERTLVEETVRRLDGLVPSDHIFVLTNEVQLPGTRTALRGLVPEAQIIAEPARRDTAPAAALATALVRARGGDAATLALLPADAFIADVASCQRQLGAALQRASSAAGIVTLAIKADHPATGFGYLELGEENWRGEAGVVRSVKRFVEKPDAATAARYVSSGNFAWNAGMFFWRVDTFLAEATRQTASLADFIRAFPAGNWASFLPKDFPPCRRFPSIMPSWKRRREWRRFWPPLIGTTSDSGRRYPGI